MERSDDTRGLSTADCAGSGAMISRVAAITEREERVPRTAPWMHAAKCGTNPGEVFDESNADFERSGSEKDVIEHGRHLIYERHVGFLLLAAEDGEWGD